MIVTALTLGALTFGAFFFLIMKIRPLLRRLMLGHPLFTDLITTIATYIFLGGAVTSMIAAGFVCVTVSILLYVLKRTYGYARIVLEKGSILGIPFPKYRIEDHAEV
ncbi:hypothetical protein DRJ17_05030 [Candidatus Woesearchaeota archaeon]|nr:MAG: hypothetical protein DRJ17_05030 [Candidatus Woesearchaeota archaeon]